MRDEIIFGLKQFPLYRYSMYRIHFTSQIGTFQINATNNKAQKIREKLNMHALAHCVKKKTTQISKFLIVKLDKKKKIYR